MEPIRLLRQDEIECRVGAVSGKGLRLLLYKDARADMKILDEVYGPLNWQRRHEVVGGSLYCTVSVWDDEKRQWVSKMDVGTESFTEKEKGQASDSFKRACVSVGIGRELYTAPDIWVPASEANIQKRGDRYFTYDRFFVGAISYNGNREIAGLVILNQDGKAVYTMKEGSGGKPAQPVDVQDGAKKGGTPEKVKEINRELERTGVALDTVLKRYGVGSIEEMPPDIYRKAMNGLRRTKSAQAA